MGVGDGHKALDYGISGYILRGETQFMAKKSQKSKAPRATTPRMYSDGAAAPKTTTGAKPATSTSSAGAAPARSSAGAAKPITTGGRGAMSLEQEYAFVMGDLRRLGIMAIAGFAFIAVVGLIFR